MTQLVVFVGLPNMRKTIQKQILSFIVVLVYQAVSQPELVSTTTIISIVKFGQTF
jgi:hypothetical protein